MAAKRRQLTLVAAITLAVTAYLVRERRHIARELSGPAGSARAEAFRSIENRQQADRVSEPGIGAILDHRIENVFPASYMTALAIIQGVGLGILLTKAQLEWLNHSSIFYHIMIGTQTLAIFVAIVVVTHRYTITE